MKEIENAYFTGRREERALLNKEIAVEAKKLIDECNKSPLYNNSVKDLRDRLLKLITFEKKDCAHIFATAVYKDRKLQGYRCNRCGAMKEVNPQFRKNKKL